jgi:hypothetical protein
VFGCILLGCWGGAFVSLGVVVRVGAECVVVGWL